MAIPANQIGRGTEENLLWQISKQLEALTGVTFNSKKTLLDVIDPYYNNPNIKAKITTVSGAWAGTFVEGSTTSPFFEIDLIQNSSVIIEYSILAFNGSTATGTFSYTAAPDGSDNSNTQSAITGDGVAIAYNRDGNLVSFSMITYGSDADVEIVYTVKLFTLPMYGD